MKTLIVCKASSKIGMGHLIRSLTLAIEISQRNENLRLIVIGDRTVNRLVYNLNFNITIIKSEDSLVLSENFDVVFFDMLHISDSSFSKIRRMGKLIVSISPVFNKLEGVDLFFNRSKYYQIQCVESPKVFAGLEYSMISNQCIRIPSSIYRYNLSQDSFPIAISMGGGDAANKTLQVLESIKYCTVPVTFWVMLGEGYSHSYNELIDVIKRDTHHEIILAKANQSMWQVLRNCILAILPGGITTYEAAFAGLPTLNLLDVKKQGYLIHELEENGVSKILGGFDDHSYEVLNQQIEYYYTHKNELLSMHMKSLNLIDTKGAERIFNKCIEFVKYRK